MLCNGRVHSSGCLVSRAQEVLLVVLALSFDASGLESTPTSAPTGCAVSSLRYTMNEAGMTPSARFGIIWVGIANSSAEAQGMACTQSATGAGVDIDCNKKICIADYRVAVSGPTGIKTVNWQIEGAHEEPAPIGKSFFAMAGVGPVGSGATSASNVADQYKSYPITNCNKKSLCQIPAYRSDLWMSLSWLSYAEYNLQVTMTITMFPFKTCGKSEAQKAIADTFLLDWKDVEILSGPTITSDPNTPTHSTLTMSVKLWIYSDFPQNPTPSVPISAQYQQKKHKAVRLAHDFVALSAKDVKSRLSKLNSNSRTLLFAFATYLSKDKKVPAGAENLGFQYTVTSSTAPPKTEHPHRSQTVEFNMATLAVAPPPSVRDQGTDPYYVVSSYVNLYSKSAADGEELISPLGQTAIQEGIASFLGVRVEYIEITKVKMELGTSVAGATGTSVEQNAGRRLYVDVGDKGINNRVPAIINFRAFLKTAVEAQKVKQELTMESVPVGTAPALLNAIKHALSNKQMPAELVGADISESSTTVIVEIPAEAQTTPAPTSPPPDTRWIGWAVGAFLLLAVAAIVAVAVFAARGGVTTPKKRAITLDEPKEPKEEVVPLKSPVVQTVYQPTSFQVLQPPLTAVTPIATTTRTMSIPTQQLVYSPGQYSPAVMRY